MSLESYKELFSVIMHSLFVLIVILVYIKLFRLIPKQSKYKLILNIPIIVICSVLYLELYIKIANNINYEITSERDSKKADIFNLINDYPYLKDKETLEIRLLKLKALYGSINEDIILKYNFKNKEDSTKITILTDKVLKDNKLNLIEYLWLLKRLEDKDNTKSVFHYITLF